MKLSDRVLSELQGVAVVVEDLDICDETRTVLREMFAKLHDERADHGGERRFESVADRFLRVAPTEGSIPSRSTKSDQRSTDAIPPEARKEARISSSERRELEDIVAAAQAEAKNRIYEHAVDCAKRARGYECNCAVGDAPSPSQRSADAPLAFAKIGRRDATPAEMTVAPYEMPVCPDCNGEETDAAGVPCWTCSGTGKAPRPVAPQEEPRFFIDHGAIHDRMTGRHVQTGIDDYDEDGTAKTCALLNELATRRESAKENGG